MNLIDVSGWLFLVICRQEEPVLSGMCHSTTHILYISLQPLHICDALMKTQKLIFVHLFNQSQIDLQVARKKTCRQKHKPEWYFQQ